MYYVIEPATVRNKHLPPPPSVFFRTSTKAAWLSVITNFGNGSRASLRLTYCPPRRSTYPTWVAVVIRCGEFTVRGVLTDIQKNGVGFVCNTAYCANAKWLHIALYDLVLYSIGARPVSAASLEESIAQC